MKVEGILDKPEGQHLEYKSARSLAEPESIAREIVGMLNAEGGTIWVGREDEKERAAGPVVDPVTDPESAKARLLDYLLETLEPAPTKNEVVIEVQPWGEGRRGLLEIRVQPSPKESGRLPAAFLRRGGRHYLRRIGARNHAMSREELFGPRASTGEVDAVDVAVRKIVDGRARFRDSDGMWIGFQPVQHLALETHANRERFDQIALDPTSTNNRRAGRHFAQSRHPVQHVKEAIRWEAWSDDWNRPASYVEVMDDGRLSFLASRWILLRGEPGEIGPWRLLEYPISAFRIARVIYSDHLKPDDKVVVDLALFGVGGCKLRPGTPVDHYFQSNEPVQWTEPDLVWDGPVWPPFTFSEIDAAPDRCGFRLVSRVYQAFGFRPEDVPREYDRETGRLILPE